ncbi:hypothetical protein EXS65_03405 [Candidatus Peribacteria bacterium]|nr:hypothetical protein [Candidatus Peribacteria bacterium]
MQTNTEHIFLEWEAPAKITPVRSEKWYIVSGISCGTMIIYGILSGAWSLSICFAMLAGLFFLIRNEKPSTHAIKLLETGIEFDGRKSTWSSWKHFWILCGEGYYELHMESRKYLVPDLVIQLGATDPYQLRDVLGQYVQQIDTKKEKLLDAIIRFCKL